MPVLSNSRPKKATIIYGSVTHAYDWSNDPFSDPVEKLNAKNAKEKKKYVKNKKVHYG